VYRTGEEILRFDNQYSIPSSKEHYFFLRLCTSFVKFVYNLSDDHSGISLFHPPGKLPAKRFHRSFSGTVTGYHEVPLFRPQITNGCIDSFLCRIDQMQSADDPVKRPASGTMPDPEEKWLFTTVHLSAVQHWWMSVPAE
jgi:hypothetical protein